MTFRTRAAGTDDAVGSCAGGLTELQEDVNNFIAFMTFVAPPERDLSDPAAANAGAVVFNNVGCNGCHVTTTFRTPAEAVQLANNTRYGLAASIWSENINVALDIAPKVKAGVVWVNCTNQFDASAGFGGYRESGFGREGAQAVDYLNAARSGRLWDAFRNGTTSQYAATYPTDKLADAPA